MLFSPVHPMHIPDGFLSTVVALTLWALTVPVVALALRRVGHDLSERQVPLMGVMAAALFAGQMLNFTVTGGTSGHLLGAAIATILLGPWGAVVVLTTVVGVQALVFQDGGLLAMGANLFNMAVIGVTVSYFVYRTVQRLAGGRRWGIFARGALAAWCSIVISALAAALELALSGTSPANIAIPAMGVIHMLIGLGEAGITLGVLAFLQAARPDLLQEEAASGPSNRAIWVSGLVLAGLLAVLSPLASRHPDGLMWVARQQGFLSAEKSPAFKLFQGYLIPGISNRTLATIMAALLGVVLIAGVALLTGWLRSRKQPK